jgi:hypothetical protein
MYRITRSEHKILDLSKDCRQLVDLVQALSALDATSIAHSCLHHMLQASC